MINWPEGEEEDIAEEGKDLVEQLLCHDPQERLGSSAIGGTSVSILQVYWDTSVSILRVY